MRVQYIVDDTQALDRDNTCTPTVGADDVEDEAQNESRLMV